MSDMTRIRLFSLHYCTLQLGFMNPKSNFLLSPDSNPPSAAQHTVTHATNPLSDTWRIIRRVDSWATRRVWIASFKWTVSTGITGGFIVQTEQAWTLLGVRSWTHPRLAERGADAGLERWQAGPLGSTHPWLREAWWREKILFTTSTLQYNFKLYTVHRLVLLWQKCASIKILMLAHNTMMVYFEYKIKQVKWCFKIFITTATISSNNTFLTFSDPLKNYCIY